MCNVEIGNRIKEIRNIAKQSQQEVADALFISPSLLSMIETGKREVSDELLSALAKHFKVTEEFLNTGVKPNFYNEHLLFANMLTSGIKQVFPIFKCSIDIKNKSFNTAYKQQEVIYKRIKDDEEVNPRRIRRTATMPRLRCLRDCVTEFNKNNRKYKIDKATVSHYMNSVQVTRYFHDNTWFINYDELEKVILRHLKAVKKRKKRKYN